MVSGYKNHSLGDWLSSIDQMGQLVRVKEAVDRNEEMSAITYLVACQEGAPAVLFESVDGYPEGYSSLWNILGSSLDRISLTLGMPTGLTANEVIAGAREKLKKRMPPVVVDPDQAAVNQILLVGNDVDVSRFPAPKHWPLDGGQYIGTGDAVITRDPDSTILNVGTYRVMAQDEKHVSLYLSPGKGAQLHIARAWQQSKPLEVAIMLGGDPLLMLVGSQGFARNVSEYDCAGGIKGEPIPVTQGATTDLLIPAHAEIVLEGIIRPHATKAEGPFGEFTGYYGRPSGEAPLVEVTAVHQRSAPILSNALMADYPACEMALFYGLLKSARVWDDLDRLGIAGIKGVYAHPAAASGFGMLVVSIEQGYAGHAAQVLALAAQSPGAAYYTKWVVAVDDDVDPTDISQVLWAMATRCDPANDIDIARNTWSTWLDPTKNPPEERLYGSKALINACKDHRHLSDFSRRTALRRSMYEQVSGKWRQLGLAGEPPLPRFFEEDAE